MDARYVEFPLVDATTRELTVKPPQVHNISVMQKWFSLFPEQNWQVLMY
jgi:hypothetical protein